MSNRRITLRTKLLGGFGVVLALMAVLSFVSMQKLDAVNEGAVVANTSVLPSIRIIDDIATNVESYRKFEYRYVATTDPAGRAKVVGKLAGVRAQLQKDFDGYDKFIADSKDRRLHEAVQAQIIKMFGGEKALLALVDAGRQGPAGALMQRQLDEVVTPLRTDLDRWNAYNTGLATKAFADAKSTLSSSKRLTIILLLVSMATGLGIAILLSRSIRKGVEQIIDRLNMLRDRCTTDLAAALRNMAAGDLTTEVTPVTPPIETWSNDEIGDVAQAVNAVRDNTVASVVAYNESRVALCELVGQVAGAAASVSSGSQQMAATSEEAGRAVGEIANAITEVATGAQRQVETVEEVRISTEQMTHATTASAENAQETALIAENARTIAEEGSEAVEQATQAMVAVREASTQATLAIRGLGAKSDQIGGIVDTITGIAEQTNLLALNAAIEAARAGEQGRGFAVVAEEVRKLAEESQTAARSIALLIGEIQDETGRAIEVVEAGGARTNEGAATVEQAREAFGRIGSSVEDVTGRVAQIAAAIQQVAASATKMQADMADVSAVAEESSASTEQVSASTQQTSASTQEISASAAELARTAGELETLVRRFQVAA
jgi:methyl-accepting chemotaxis protein